MDDLNSSDVGVIPESPATIGTDDTATVVDAVSDDKLSATDDTTTNVTEIDEETTEIDADIDKQLAEKPQDQEDLAYFRGLLRAKEKEARELRNRQPEYGETEQLAIDLYKGLTSFDNETGRPTAKAFAQKLVERDPALATEASWDLLNQQVDANGMTIGHQLLERMGLNPYRLEELRQFSKGEIKGEQYGITAIPETVPQEFADAYKALSRINRDDVDIYLEGDDEQKAAGLEILRNKQDKLDFDRMRTEQTRTQTESLQREINTQIEKEETETFTNLLESFKDTPTYTAATVSGNPEMDAGIKNIVSMAILGLGYPDSVFGQQATKFFEGLGVQVNPQELSTLVNEISGNIQSAVKAEKGNFLPAKAEAVARRDDAVRRASAKRNAIFAQAISKMAGSMKQISETNGTVLEANGGMPRLEGNGAPQPQGEKLSTLEIIKQMSQPAGR